MSGYGYIPTFDGLAPTTTKGDVVVHNGEDNVRLGVGADGQHLEADSTSPSGLKWGDAGGGLYLGYYADETALTSAHPTATDGNYAILGSTDTVWVWDSGTTAWVDTNNAPSLPLTTKGDLYGYSTAGARVAVGTNGQLLSADSAEATGLKWIDAPSGGSSVFDATVADSGADYTDIDTAYNAGMRSLHISGDLTQGGNVTVDAGDLFIMIPEATTLNMGDYTLSTDGLGSSITIEGQSQRTSKLVFAHTSGLPLTGMTANTGTLRRIRMENNSTVAGAKCGMWTGGIYNCDFALPDLVACGVEIYQRGVAVDVSIEGGGSNCYNAFVLDTTSRATNITFDGTFSQTAGQNIINISGVATNVYVHTATGQYVYMYVSGLLTNFEARTGFPSRVYISNYGKMANINRGYITLYGDGLLSNSECTRITVDGAGAKINNCEASALGINGTYFQISNTIINGNAITISNGADYGSMTNVYTNDEITLRGDHCKLSNCTAEDAFDVYGNYNSITASRCGTNAGGGTTQTISLKTGATGNIVTCSHSDIAIVDLGTSSVVANNVVY